MFIITYNLNSAPKKDKGENTPHTHPTSPPTSAPTKPQRTPSSNPRPSKPNFQKRGAEKWKELEAFYKFRTADGTSVPWNN